MPHTPRKPTKLDIRILHKLRNSTNATVAVEPKLTYIENEWEPRVDHISVATPSGFSASYLGTPEQVMALLADRRVTKLCYGPELELDLPSHTIENHFNRQDEVWIRHSLGGPPPTLDEAEGLFQIGSHREQQCGCACTECRALRIVEFSRCSKLGEAHELF